MMFGRKKIYKNTFSYTGSKEAVLRDLKNIISIIQSLDANEIKIKLEITAFKVKRKK